MLIARFASGTTWAGKTITYDGRHFIIENRGPVTARTVLDWEAQGFLVFASHQTRKCVHKLARVSLLDQLQVDGALPVIAIICAVLAVAIIGVSAAT